MSTGSKKVDFFCIGAAKAGTTWLYQQLSQHPGVARARAKEINYFNPQHPEYPDRPNPDFEQPIAWYHAHFEACDPALLWADYATAYLRYPASATRIKRYQPDAKLIVLLRDPVDRALSHHRFLYQWGLVEEEDFRAAAKKHENILQSGLYGAQLSAWMQHFPAEQFLLPDYARISTDPAALLQEVHDFLGLPAFIPDRLHERPNASKGIRSKRLHKGIQWLRAGWQALPAKDRMSPTLTRLGARRLLHRLYASNQGEHQLPPLDAATHQWLRDYYHHDQQKLKALIGWSHWA